MPVAVEPVNEDLSNRAATSGLPGSNIVLEDAHPETLEAGAAHVTLTVRSDPPGAHVSLDDRYLGRTPLRLQIDPRSDHVLHFERQGCQEHVQLLSSASWERGRSPELVVKLDCP